MRHRHAHPCAVLALQIHHHARRQEEGRTSKYLHRKREEECPDHVVSVERAAGETTCDVSDDEKDSAISGMVRPAEEAWVSKGGDLREQISIRDVSTRRRGTLTTAPVIIVVLSSARPTPIARLTCPAWAKDSNPTIVRALVPVLFRGSSPDHATSATTRRKSAWMKVVRINQPRFRVRTWCASCPNTKLPTMKLRSCMSATVLEVLETDGRVHTS